MADSDFVQDGNNLWYTVEGDENHLPGWYFSDETEDFHGPFASRAEAEKNLAKYGAWLSGEDK